jgi:putative phosphotransacetylase
MEVNKKKILVEISNRHIHISREDIDELFGKGYKLNVFRKLNQPGEFAAEECIGLKHGDKIIENVRIVGPARKNTQIELLRSDAKYLGINVPVRKSGHIEDTPGIILIGPKHSIELTKGVIISKNHLHATHEDAKELGISHNDIVNIKVTGEKEVVLEDVLVRVHKDHSLSIHIDKDESEKHGVLKNSYGHVIRK